MSWNLRFSSLVHLSKVTYLLPYYTKFLIIKQNIMLDQEFQYYLDNQLNLLKIFEV